MKREYFPPLAVMLLGAYIFYDSNHLPPSMYQPLGAGAYSKIIVLILLFFGAVCLWDMKKKTGAQNTATPNRTGGKFAQTQAVLFAGLVVLYTFGFSWLGFFSTSFLFITLSIFLLAERKLKDLARGATVALVVVGLVYVCFRVFLNLYFPDALLI